MRRYLFAVAALTGMAGQAVASFHEMEIAEVMTGANGDRSVQFVELRMLNAGQNFVDGLTIVARNEDGTSAVTVFTFPAGASGQISGNSGDSILIATRKFSERTGIVPDFYFNGGLFPMSGQIDFAAGTVTMSYGAYSGAGIHVSNAPAAPGADLRSLVRTGATGNDGADYQMQANAPRNNDGQTGSINSVNHQPLRITEADPLNDVVEVTNVDVSTVTLAGNYFFSHLADTSSFIPAATVFAPGQSTTFTVTGLNDTDSDLWLYEDNNFANPASVQSGLKWGPAAGVGQVATAVAAGVWPSTTSFVAAPGGGQSLRLTAYDNRVATNWAVTTPNLGAFLGTGTTIGNPYSALQSGSIAVELQSVAGGLIAPLGLCESPDGTGRLFIHDQAGKVHIVQNGALLPTPFLDVSSRLVPLGLFPPLNYDERGLLGFAIHPDYASNGKVYTYTTEPTTTGTADFAPGVPGPAAGFDHQNVVAEWTVSGNPNVADPLSRRELLRIDHPQFNHDGGIIQFGPDKMLYIGIGDGGNADDQGAGHEANGNAQNPHVIHGSVLRINPFGNNSTNANYGIPPDNPFATGVDGLREVWAYGFRNPFAFSFDQGTGLLYLGDAGQNQIEEVDIVSTGVNYGWRLKEGSFFFDPGVSPNSDGNLKTIPVKPVPVDVGEPAMEYDHSEGSVVIGGYVYRGSALPALQGRYVTGDFGGFGSPTGRLFYLDDENVLKEFVLGATDRNLNMWLKGFGQDLSGEVYVCASTRLGPFGSTGQVLKLVPLGAASAGWEMYE